MISRENQTTTIHAKKYDIHDVIVQLTTGNTVSADDDRIIPRIPKKKKNERGHKTINNINYDIALRGRRTRMCCLRLTYA